MNDEFQSIKTRRHSDKERELLRRIESNTLNDRDIADIQNSGVGKLKKGLNKLANKARSEKIALERVHGKGSYDRKEGTDLIKDIPLQGIL